MIQPPDEANSHAEASQCVDVICCFLNAEAFLAEAVTSVLSQTHGNLRLVLVDDGSFDRSAAIARSFAERDPRVVYLAHPGGANLGASLSRNAGIAASHAPFIAFIDADDVWQRTKLEQQLDILKANPEAGAVCGTVLYWESWSGGKDRLVPSGHVSESISMPPESFLRIYPIGSADAAVPSDIMVRRKIVEVIGGFEHRFTGKYAFYEDQAFLVKLYLNAPVYFSSQCWTKYRKHQESVMSEMRRKGQYHVGRAFFLRWLQSYMKRGSFPAEARAAARKALQPYLIPGYMFVRTKVAGPLLRKLHILSSKQ